MSYPAIKFIVPGKPIAKGRPRLRVFKTAEGKFKGASTYTPEKTVRFESIVRDKAEAVMEKYGLKPLQGLVKVHIKAYWEWPKSKFKKKDPLPEAYFTSKPDGDNILKSCCDAINSICYLDDQQIVIATVEKWRAKQGDPARSEIIIWSLDNEWQITDKE